MLPVLIISLLDPVFWAIGSFGVWCGYRLSNRSWIRLPLAIICFPSMIGVIVLQSHVLRKFEPAGFDPKTIDYALFPDIIGGLVCMVYVAVREDRARKRRLATGR